jgi:Fe-S-cluster-containing dehydrogenase component
MAESEKAEGKNKKVLRREFLKGSGTALAAGALSVCAAESTMASASPAPDTKVTYEASTGYLVYDSRLCWGCQSCMFACSMGHQGEANPASG